jgi:hypothetical protein
MAPARILAREPQHQLPQLSPQRGRPHDRDRRRFACGFTGPCPRWVMTTLPQGDLPKDAGILRVAAQHNHANVGVFADVIAGGTTRRGDPVTLA